MDFSEKKISLSDQDIEKIISIRKKIITGTTVFGIFFFGSLTIPFFGMLSDGGPGIIFLILFALVAAGVFGFVLNAVLKKLKKDIESGLKRRISGTVTAKKNEVNRRRTNDVQVSRLYYYFFFGDTQIKVDRITYENAEIGNSVEVDLSLESETVLGFRKLTQ